MNKVVIIGDIHGRTIWKNIVEKEGKATYIFLGDYFDPYENYSAEHLINNFKEILTFKEQNYRDVNLLVGNHDLSYIHQSASRCRFSYNVFTRVQEIMYNLVEGNVLKLCNFITDKIICSHAGFTKTWLEQNNLKLAPKLLNETFKNSILEGNIYSYDFILKHMGQSMYGDDIWQGPLWVRPHSLRIDSPQDIYQIVGHTQNDWQENIQLQKVTLCDSLEFNKYYTLTETDNNEINFKMKIY